jgi:phage I-like protein
MSGVATALCAAISIGNADGGAPEWVHLLPAGDIRGRDGRGPYRATDMAAIIAASLAGGKLVLDENHATDLAAPKGQSAPARGWIVDLHHREDGLWGKVDWTEEGRSIVSGYRGISPAIVHQKDGTVLAIARASLTNTPNFAGLVALHQQEKTMDFRVWLVGALGLPSDADDEAIKAAFEKLVKAPAAEVALQSALNPIAVAAGLAEGSDAAAVLAGVMQLAGGADDRVVALQSELAGVTTRLNTLTEASTRKDAVAFVDAAIAAGRVGVKPQRDRYISMHMKDAAEAEALVNAMPILAPGATTLTVVDQREGTVDNPALMARKAQAYQRKLAGEGVTISIATAVRAVQEGKAE